MGTNPTHRFVGTALLAALCGLACSHQTTSPEQKTLSPAMALAPVTDVLGRSGGLVDLGLHRTTREEGTQRLRITLTGQSPGPWQEFPETVEREVVGTQTPVPGGPAYVADHVTTTVGDSPFESVDLWRQDRSGLFLYSPDEGAAIPQSLKRAAGAGLDAARAAAFERAFAEVETKLRAARGFADGSDPALQRGGTRSAGVGANEITFLLYPLHPGASWEGRIGFNVWTVEAMEPIVTGAGRFTAARLRIELPDFFGPNDFVHTWWATPGQVRWSFHALGEATDENGNVIGTVEFEENYELTAWTAAPAS